jgi:DNA-directed RNA polymerase specialized sigma24 family protein
VSDSGTVTDWLGRLVEGDPAAARRLWERYFHRLVARAHRKLAGAPRGAADEEDVALSAFDSFCRAAAAGRFPRLQDRDDLWRLLLVLTDRKAINQRKHATREKRMPRNGKVLDEGALPATDSAGGSPLAQLPDREPTPAYAAQVAETWQELFGLLRAEKEDPDLEPVALMKMEGYSLKEIAAKLGCHPRSVQRRLHFIRRLWQEKGPS